MDIKILRWLVVGMIFSEISCFASVRKDSLRDYTKFYNMSLLKASENGHWVVASKMYKDNKDTAVVLGTQKSYSKSVVATLTKMSQFYFLKGERLLASGNGIAALYNLKTGRRKECLVTLQGTKKDIAESGVLNDGIEYYLLTKDGTLLIYNSASELTNQIENVKDLKINKLNFKLFIIKNLEVGEQIIQYSDGRLVDIYKTSNLIRHSEFSYSGNFLLLKEETRERGAAIGGLQKIVFIDIKNGAVEFPDIPALDRKDFVRFTEIQDGKAMMVTAIEHIPVSENTVDIWYGNDGNLEAKQFGEFNYKHWIWRVSDHSTFHIPKDHLSIHFSLDNPDYFIAFNGDELQNYNTLFPMINAYLYDRKNNQYSNLGIMYPEIITSPNGKCFLYRNKESIWTLVDLKSVNKKQLSTKGLRNPRFSNDNQYVIFESDAGLWQYHISGDKMVEVQYGKDYQLKIVTKRDKNLYPQSGYEFLSRNINLNKPVLVMANKKGSLEQIFLRWKNGRFEKFLNAADSTIKLAAFTDYEDYYLYIEERLHIPPRIMFKDRKKREAKIIYESNKHDHTSSLLRRDIAEYKSSAGQILKGILYYPIAYDKNKKYPMVVHIYEIQSKNANQYLSPLNNFPIGFSIRNLLEEGYFVYLPDIVNDSKGVGYSALNCVNTALDAVKENHNIDMNKVGLIGHSFGGYQTNFIATHSDRFKAYISGASAADLIRMYFSYNYTSLTPFYWQFEEGQYNMHNSYANDKKLYIDNNPIHNVENVNAPILLWTGKNDQRIVWDQTMEFYIGLKRNNKNVIALFYPGQAHNFTTGSDAESDLALKILNWWDYFLKDKKEFSWIQKQIKKDAN